MEAPIAAPLWKQEIGRVHDRRDAVELVGTTVIDQTLRIGARLAGEIRASRANQIGAI